MAGASRIHSYDDARRMARRSLPPPLFDYVDGGADGELTMGENERVFDRVAFKAKAAVYVREPSIETTVLGSPLSVPVLLSPCGLTQAMHPDGVLGAARAANAQGSIFTLSTFSGAPPEDLADEPGPRWFQVYATSRGMAEDLVTRAADTKHDALVVTIDTPTSGKRERDLHHGIPGGNFKLTPKTALRFAPSMVTRPQWVMRMAASTIQSLRTSPMPGDPPPEAAGTGSGGGEKPAPSAAALPTKDASRKRKERMMLVSPYTWDDIVWFREQWQQPLVVKGILSADDARRAVDLGADAIVVSNHGGRQLDGVPPTLAVLPEVVAAVGDRTEVLVDSGIRRGNDVVKAIALGARAAMVGRPYLYALAAAGQEGVEKLLKMFANDMRRALMLMGCPDLESLDPTWLRDANPAILGR
jgi:L-lactate dehydrogenase (cytochrome)